VISFFVGSLGSTWADATIAQITASNGKAESQSCTPLLTRGLDGRFRFSYGLANSRANPG
jgi:hypothetical protein